MARLQYYRDFEVYQYANLASKKIASKLKELVREREFAYDNFKNYMINLEIETLIDRIKNKPITSETGNLELGLKWKNNSKKHYV